MIDESELRDTLKTILFLNKKVADMSIAALTEIASIRETVRGLDPTFSEILSTKQTYYRERTDQLSAEIKQECDSLVERLNDRLIR